MAAAGERLRQGAQIALLDEAARDRGRPCQLGGQVVEIEGLGQGGGEDEQQSDQLAHARALSTASMKTLGEASCISRLAMSTATCTVLARVRRSPVAASLIR